MTTILNFLKSVMDWMFPKGIGTKAVLAFTIVGYGVSKLNAADLKEVVLMVVATYFVLKAANGNKGG